MTLTLLALGDDLAIEYVECGKQRGRSTALVVVSNGCITALFIASPGWVKSSACT